MIEDGRRVPLDLPRIECAGARGVRRSVGRTSTPDAILAETFKNLYDGVPLEEVHKSAILAARALIEKDPAYTYVTARLLLHTMRREALGEEVAQAAMAERYAEYFPEVHPLRHRGRAARRASSPLFDLKRLGGSAQARARPAVQLSRPADAVRPLLPAPCRAVAFELPQAFFMRVAMGLALNEIDREARAIEFYEVLSSVRLHEFDADAI